MVKPWAGRSWSAVISRGIPTSSPASSRARVSVSSGSLAGGAAIVTVPSHPSGAWTPERPNDAAAALGDRFVVLAGTSRQKQTHHNGRRHQTPHPAHARMLWPKGAR